MAPPSTGDAIRVSVEPDYFQFYARRGGTSWPSDRVPEEGYAARLWSDGHFVYVGTARKYGTLPLSITVRESHPGDVDRSAQHVAEVSLTGGGPLEVFDWGGDEPTLTVDVPDGPVRLRVSWTGLVEGRFEGLDDTGDSGESLAFELWSAPVGPPVVVRGWSGWPW